MAGVTCHIEKKVLAHRGNIHPELPRTRTKGDRIEGAFHPLAARRAIKIYIMEMVLCEQTQTGDDSWRQK